MKHTLNFFYKVTLFPIIITLVFGLFTLTISPVSAATSLNVGLSPLFWNWNAPLSKDTFTDTNNQDLKTHTPDIGPNWSIQSNSSEWRIQNNQLTRTAGAIAHANVDVGQSNMRACADFTKFATQSNLYSIMVRWQDPVHYWEIFYDNQNNGWQMSLVDGGADQFQGPLLSGGSTGTVCISAVGDTITAQSPNGDTYSVTNSRFNTNTKAALILDGNYFPNDPTPPPTEASVIDNWIVVGPSSSTVMAQSTFLTGLPGSVTNTMLAGSITANKLVGTDITTLGTVTNGVWNATPIGVNKGGTGLSSYGTANQILGMNGSADGAEYKSIATGTSGSDFNIANASGLITFNLPDASQTSRGVITTGAQIFSGDKKFAGKVGVGDNTPASLFTVGNGDLFQVNGSGAIVAATGIQSSGTITFTGVSAGASETSALLVNGSNQLVTKTLGSNAFTSGTYLSTEADTLQSVTGRNATTSNNIKLNGGATIRNLEVDNATANTDRLAIKVDDTQITGTYTGTITNKDLTNDRQYFLPDNSGTVITSGDVGTVTATMLASATIPSSKLVGTDINTVGTITAGIWHGSTIDVWRGGTGVTATPTNGQLLVGNGSGYTLANITAGPGLAVNNGAGTISIASTLGIDINLASETTGTLPIAKGGTNGSASPTAGGISYGTGSSYAFTAAGENGQILTSNGSTTPTWQSINFTESDTLSSITTRGATTATQLQLNGGASLRGLFVESSNANDDRITTEITSNGSNRFDGKITNADLTANRTYVLPDTSGMFLMSTGSAASLTNFPILNQDTTGKSASTDGLNSATTVVNVSAAAAPTAGKVLTAVDATHAVWQSLPTVINGQTISSNSNFNGSMIVGDGTGSDTTVFNTGSGVFTVKPNLTAGNPVLLQSNVLKQTGTYNALNVNLGNITPDGTSPIRGIAVTNPAVDNTSNAVALMINGSNWDTDISLQNGATIDNNTPGLLDFGATLRFNIATAGDTNIGLCKDKADGNGTDISLRECKSTAGDIAEYYAAEPNLRPGDVVAVQTSHGKPTLHKTSHAYESDVFSVVSTYPVGQFGKPLSTDTIDKSDNPTALGISGKVPVRVNTEGGVIKVGDPLVSSSTAGVAMKATKAGKIIGYALESFDGSVKVSREVRNQESLRDQSAVKYSLEPKDPTSKTEGKIIVYLSSGYYYPEFATSQIQITKLAKDVNTLESRVTSLATKALNHAGKMTIPKGQTTISIRFDTAFATEPIVTALLVGPNEVNRIYADHITAKGFDLVIYPAQKHDVTVDWHATQAQ